LERIRAEAPRVALPDDIRRLLEAMRKHLAEQAVARAADKKDKLANLGVSDRRWRKIVGLLKTSAHTDGRDSVSLWDCWLLQHATWNKPEERESVAEWYKGRVGAAHAADPTLLLKIAESWEKKLALARSREEVAKDEEGRTIYLHPDGRESLQRTVRVARIPGVFLRRRHGRRRANHASGGPTPSRELVASGCRPGDRRRVPRSGAGGRKHAVGTGIARRTPPRCARRRLAEPGAGGAVQAGPRLRLVGRDGR